MKLINIGIIMLFLVGLIQNQVLAQSEKAIATREVAGTVLRKDSSVLSIQTNNGVRELSIPDNIKITRNYMSSTISEIQPNDKVKVQVADSGQILSVDVTSGSLVEKTSMLVPLLIGAALAAGAVLLLVKKRDEQHIKTKIVEPNS
jgi:hypothetical protein